MATADAHTTLSPRETAPDTRKSDTGTSDTGQSTPAGAARSPGWLRVGIWHLRHRGGMTIVDRLLFLADGWVWSGSSTIWRWQFHGETLVVFALDGTRFMEFSQREGAPSPVPSLAGRLVNATEDALDLILSPMPEPPPLDQTTRTLNASVVLGTASDTLLVTLNSIARPFDGREYGAQWRWEFYELPGRIGVDHVRLAERADPPCWYIDKTRRICALIGGLLGNGYRQVVFCGMSSGGYGSMLLAEMLCLRYPDVMFHTATINPQTGHAEEHRQAMARLPHAIPPAVLSDQAYAARDCAESEIQMLALRRGPRPNIAHTIFYDSANPAETYYVRLVQGLPGFAFKPFPFGVGHMSGCTALHERRLVHAHVEELCRAVGGGSER